MTHYINTLTGEYPVTFEQLRAQYPQTMFPQDFAGDFEHFASVSMDDYPAYDAATHKVVALAPVLTDGEWQQAWEIVALSQQEIDAARQALVPASVTRRQARQALLLAGLLDDVQPAIDAIPDPQQRGLAQIEWDDSQEFERHRPLLIQLAGALGLDGEALDGLFVQAAGL